MVTWQWTAAIWKGPMIESGIFNSMLTLLAGLMGLRSTEKWAGVATEAVKGLPKLLTRKKG
jgi:hypothetical protein